MPRIGIGLGIGRQRVSGGGVVFDADYQAILNYATAGGITLPSSSVQSLQNKLMLDIKTSGAWSKLDSFFIFANIGSSVFAEIDWSRTVRLSALTRFTPVSSPTFTNKQGYTGNGTSSCIDTTFNPASAPPSGSWNYQAENASRYYFHFSGTDQDVDGNDGGLLNNQIRLNNTASQTINNDNTLPSTFSFSTTQGVKSIHRVGNTVTCYNDKTGSSFTTTGTNAVVSRNQFVLRRGGSAFSNNTGFGYAMGASMTAENNAFVDALNNYMTELAKLP